MDAFDGEFGCTSRAAGVGKTTEVGEEAFDLFGGFGFGSEGVYPYVSREVVDAEQEMDEAADGCFEGTCEVCEDAFAGASCSLCPWSVMWKSAGCGELAAVAWR